MGFLKLKAQKYYSVWQNAVNYMKQMKKYCVLQMNNL